MCEDTPEQAELRRQVERFAEAEIRPREREWAGLERYPRELLSGLAASGLLAAGFAAEDGGGGGGLAERCILMEELARASAGFALGVYVHTALAAQALAQRAPEPLRTRWLPELLAGRAVGAWAYAEPGSGADVTRVRLRARLDGAHYVLDGSKAFITNGTVADLILVVARTSGEPGSLEGVSVLAVDGGAPGLERRLAPKLGMQPSELAELHFDGCRVPADRLVGSAGRGFRECLPVLEQGRPVGAAIALGIARAALDATLRHVASREQFGAPLARQQAVRFTVADMVARLAAARRLVFGAARALDAGRDARTEASLAKLVASESATWIAERALHLHGAHGYLLESPVQRHYRDCKVIEWGEGVNELQREMIFEAAARGYRP